MGEIQRERSEFVLLENLAAFDPHLQNRIGDIEAGLSPNGQSPNGILTTALISEKPGDQQEFIDEYHWALSLAAYPYHEEESRETLMSAAVDGLFMAGESYNTETEPNFLKHLSKTVGAYLEDVFGPAPEADLPPADEFERFVLEHTVFDEVPPLPTERRASAFRAGQRLLVLMEAELTDVRIESLEAYEGLWKYESAEVPGEELRKRREYLEQYCELMPRGTVLPDPEYMRRLKLLQPQFQRLVPDTRPGFIHVRKVHRGRGPNGIIIDMDRPEVVPLDAWRHLKADPDYREAYLSDGEPHARKRDLLEGAIQARIEREKVTRVDAHCGDGEPSPRRARLVARPKSGLPVYETSQC